MLSAFAQKNHKIQRQSLPKGRWACKGRPWKSNSQGTFPLLVMPLLNRPFCGVSRRDFPNGRGRQWSVCSRPWEKRTHMRSTYGRQGFCLSRMQNSWPSHGFRSAFSCHCARISGRRWSAGGTLDLRLMAFCGELPQLRDDGRLLAGA